MTAMQKYKYLEYMYIYSFMCNIQYNHCYWFVLYTITYCSHPVQHIGLHGNIKITLWEFKFGNDTSLPRRADDAVAIKEEQCRKIYFLFAKSFIKQSKLILPKWTDRTDRTVFVHFEIPWAFFMDLIYWSFCSSPSLKWRKLGCVNLPPKTCQNSTFCICEQTVLV